ncbi:hypothetical protein MKX03_003792 [Papaver bracteatum]|nr:hypothetical protein MKX03_003792 [Papaver bracteatum]
MAGIVVVFDFDKTIIDHDSDNYVIDELGFTQLFDELLPTMPWNTLMDNMMLELHSNGKTIEDIANVLRRAPLDPNIISAIKSAHALGCELKILSDANMFFIETILEHHGLSGYFSEINTNPGFVDDQGRLRIFPYHDFTTAPHGCTTACHGCPICPPNMCKGLIFDRIKAEAYADGKKRIIYLGDGKGDYCPSLMLEQSDRLMPRKDYPLWELIISDPSLIKAEIHEWSNGKEQEQILLQLINTIIFEDTNINAAGVTLLAGDCKFQTIPVSNHESFPKVLTVPIKS